ncbi:family 43 glycosylhydrolase [Bacteroides ovatus]|uniref:Glycosyl hydrolases family 43 n=1 Tax=Bacteroides ovatus TaxID=28116 RepID=A0A1G8CNZ4_BACOV|nr:family 43 glycosylhydrolase [Bacteroides ovatus]SDH47261.1 Glycosyl hydrolases family 43 [Bacteroides ovatus]
MKPFTRKASHYLLLMALAAGTLGASASVTEDIKTYKGTPFKKLEVPGTIEVEDYDEGGPGVAYNFKNSQNGNAKSYREDKGVALSKNGQKIIIGNTSGGDWTNYTIQVTQDGIYTIETFCVSGSGNGRFYYELDGKPACKLQHAPDDNWDRVDRSVKTEGVRMKAGKHILKWYTYGGMNIDKFVFTRTGDLVGGNAEQGGFDYKYPIVTKQKRNPLFVNLPSQMHNSPFTGNLYTADPSAHVWKINGKDRLYVYASHDMEPTKGCDHMDRYHVFSTEDMKTWTDHGEILNAEQTNKATGFTGDGFMWAPDCAYNPKDKNYYFYYPHKVNIKETGKAEWRIFVATSKEPAANFKVKGYIAGIPSTIDPCVFVDDDGQPYIYTSGAGKGGWGCKLKKDDWTKLDGEMTPMSGFVDFHEAPWVFKRNGKYYMIHSDNHRTNIGGNQMIHAISDNPLGPWKNCGVYMYPTGEETTHGSIVEFKGKWYMFYHTSNFSGQGALRSVCFDPVEFNADGTIKVVRNWGTPKGGKAPEVSLAKATKIEAENFNEGGSHYGYYKRPEEGDIKVETKDGATYLSHNKRKEWTRYTINVKDAGRYNITCMMRQNRGGSRFYLGVDGTWVRSSEINLTSPSNKWEAMTLSNIEMQPGEHYIEWRSMMGDIDLDWISVEAAVNSAPGVIEAEDYDDNGYEFKNGNLGNHKNYRNDKGVAISVNNTCVHVSNTSRGDWMNYTFKAQEGTYDVIVYAATINNGGFSLSFDDYAQESEEFSVKTGDWQKYEPFKMENVKLTAGKHVMTLNIVNAINIDRIEFVKK